MDNLSNNDNGESKGSDSTWAREIAVHLGLVVFVVLMFAFVYLGVTLWWSITH